MVIKNLFFYCFILGLLFANTFCATQGKSKFYNPHLPPSTPILKKDSIVGFAKTLLGNKYRFWGSTPEKGFDDPGLVSYVFAQFQFSIQSNVRAQYKKSIAITKDSMQISDLVLFRVPFYYRNILHHIFHIGIVVDRDTMNNAFLFIHALWGKGVVLSSSTDSTYAKLFYGFRRLTNPRSTAH